MGKIFYIMGKSASGKDRIYSLLEDQRELKLKTVVLYTTRRSYHTVYGIWTYFTADDGQVNLTESDYLGIGTLESFMKLKKYYGENAVCPVYIQVEDGERLSRALKREKEQENPKYEEMCRRFIADQSDFSEENIQSAGIEKRFQNKDLDICVKEIVNYIKSMQ